MNRLQVFAEDHPMVEPAILGMMTRVSKSRLELIEMTETTPDKVTPCTMVSFSCCTLALM